MQISNEITEKTTDNGLSLIEQTNYVINNELDPRMKEIKQKEAIYQSIMSEANSYSNEWQEFLRQHDDINRALSNGQYKNQTCDFLTKVLTAFRQFLDSGQPSPLTPFEQSSAQQQQPQTINFDGITESNDSGAMLPDEQPFVEEEEENDN
mgnify:FL=1